MITTSSYVLRYGASTEVTVVRRVRFVKALHVCEFNGILLKQHPAGGVSTAMTCLPHDSLIHAYHPEGCRTELSTGEKLCLCSERDFCNASTTTDLSLLLPLLIITLL
ncbi:hypothetical protein DICVIV_02379 [Dictyocaulus viviparus]|uniref:Uncharacterized protein n=1 Tax=Dictyocaulus viviparus TaxID=29172 RepID=A0A0D8Y5J5_DICVI|nr:hypothetical protein DICVIV_02379 [Dictyocaulus viviparus]